MDTAVQTPESKVMKMMDPVNHSKAEILPYDFSNSINL